MRRLLTVLMLAALALSALATAFAQTALDAFNAIMADNTTNPSFAAKTSDACLGEIMAGNYDALMLIGMDAQSIREELDKLSAITNKDLAAYAATQGLSVAQVRNAYYLALANVLRAEIQANPATEEKYKNAQLILSLFLDKDPDAQAGNSRSTIRSSMTGRYAATIAANYRIPADFVEYVIMNENWDDNDWTNDDDWKSEVASKDAASKSEAIKFGSRDGVGSESVKELQRKLIAMGYLNGKADGIFGIATENALREFQLANGLKGDGIYDSDDRRQIDSTGVVMRRDYDDSFDDSIYSTVNTGYRDSYDFMPDYDNTYDKTYNRTYDKTYDKTYDRTYDKTYDNSH